MAFIICFSEFLLIFENKTLDQPQVVRSHSSIASQENGGVQPELAVPVRRSDVDVRGLIPFVGVKVESE